MKLKDKKFVWRNIDGVNYLSEDYNNELIKLERKETLKEIIKLIKERRKTLRLEVKIYKDEARGDREIELDYLEEDLNKLLDKNE